MNTSNREGLKCLKYKKKKKKRSKIGKWENKEVSPKWVLEKY